ncbi:MAG: hypothetical protein DCF16_11555 [Alphaproteobacteria bacterium]|nr:MAG: hypothetical protein DCF16_11555 [Alphaproteobacteria bacterium]
MIQAQEIERLASRVRAATRDGGLIETAQVKLVGLDEVRAAAGTRWPRMREHVRDGSLKIIAQRIGPEDAVIPCGDGFLVVFADASADETKARCADIRDALVAFYLGEEKLAALKADVQRETVTASHLAGLVAEKAPAKTAVRQRNDLKIGRFWPVWSARRMAVAAYICGPAIEARGGWRLAYNPGYLETGAHRHTDYLDLDLCLLEQACASAEHEGAAAIGVTVHATTMQNRRSRMIYLEHLAANASPVQQRMFITVAEIEPGTPLMSLTDWTRALKRYFPRVGLELHHDDRAIGALAATGAWAAGYHLPTGRISSSAQARKTLNHLDAWCNTLTRQGIMPFIGGFQDAGLLDLASFSDLAFVTGEALWPSQTAPTGLQLATLARSSEGARA